jgi:hypothetical protein
MSGVSHPYKLEWFDLMKRAQQKLKQAKKHQGALFCCTISLA